MGVKKTGLPAILQRRRDVSAFAVEAAFPERAGRDVLLVEEVARADGEVKAGKVRVLPAEVVGETRVEQRVGRHLDLMARAPDLAAVAHAEASAETCRRAVLDRVVRPKRNLMLRRQEERHAEVGIVALRDFRIEISVSAHEIETVGDADPGLGLQAADPRFAGLDLCPGIGRRRIEIAGQDILACEVENGDREEAVAALRLIFDADFILLSGRRPERIAIAVEPDLDRKSVV